MNIKLRRVTAAVLVLIMILGNFVFSGNEVLAEEGSLSEIMGVIDPLWYDLENDIGILYDLVDKGDTDQGIKLDGIESNLIQIRYTAAVDDGIVINEGLSGQRMTFTLETGLSGSRANFDDYSAAMTIPDNIDISTFEFNSENVTRDYSFGRINGKNVLIVNFGEAKVGSTVTVSWSASYKTETTPDRYEGKSLVYVTGTPYIPDDNGEKIYEDPKMPRWKEAEATAAALADSEVTIVKSIINGSNGKAYEKELIYDDNGKFEKYVYTVTYSIDVIRNKKVREFGSLMIDTFELKDIIERGAGGGKADISLEDDSYGEPQTDPATSTITWNFTNVDFTDLSTANNGDTYRLKKPVIVKAAYDENSFVAQQPGVIIHNIATGSGRFIDGTEIKPNRGEVSFILPDKSNINPGVKITKTLAAGENPVSYADPLNGKLPLGFNLTIINTGNVIVDAIITDSEITLKDKDENGLPSVAGKDYIINGITLPAWNGLRQFAGIDVYYKSAEGSYLKTGETYTDFTAPVTITPEQPWHGIKIEVLDLVEYARVENIRLDIELNNAGVLAGNVDDEGNFIGLVEVVGNKALGSYRYNGAEEPAGEADAKWNIRYNPILPAKLEKSVTSCQTFNFVDFKYGKDIEFNVTFENTTGFKLDTLEINDNEIMFYDAASNPRNQVALQYEILGLTAKRGIFDIPPEQISVDEKGFVCNLQNVDKGEVVTFKIVIRVANADMTPFKTVENSASAKYTYGGYEKRIYADAAIVNVNTDAKGYIAKTAQSPAIPLFDADGKGLYVSSQFLKYTITVRNDGQTDLERYKVYEDYTENSQNPNNPEDASNSLNMQLRSEDKSAYIFPGGKAFSDFAKIIDIEMDQQRPGESKPQILENGVAFSAVFNNLAIGETRTLTVTVELYKVNPGEEYWWISNEAKYSYKINSSEEEYTKGGKSETVWTEIIKPDVTARLNKANTFAKSDELVLLEQTSYMIDAAIATNVGLKTLTITDDGLKFFKTGTEDSIVFEPGRTKYDYAWIDKITVPDFFAQTGASGAYEPFYGDDISNVKAYIEYRLVGSGGNQAGDWETYSINLNGADIYANGKFTLTANEIEQGAKFAEVRIVFENFPPKTNTDGIPVERRLGTKECPIEIGVQLRELLLLSFQQKALDPAGNPMGKFDLKNNAIMSWTFGDGIGTGSGQAVINGDVAVISESDAVVDHKKAVSPNSIQFSPDLKNGTVLKYTFTNENIGPDIGQLAIYDNGLIFLSSNRTIIPEPPDYEIKNVVVEITSPKEVKDYKGGITLYWSKTKNGATDSSFDDDHYISLPYSESGIYSFTGLNGLEDGVLRFKIVFGDSTNPVPKGFMVSTKFDVKVAAKEDLWDDVTAIRNVSKATYKFIGRNDEYLASQKLADTNVLAVLAADVFKTAKAGVYNTGVNQYPSGTDGKDNEIHISMKDVFEKGVGISYKITAENSGTLSAGMTITDKTKLVFSGGDKSNASPAGGIMHLQYLMLPKTLVEGNNIISMVSTASDQNSPDGIEFVQSGDESDGYYKYTVSQNYDADSFEIVLKDIAAGEKFDIYADYIVKTDYNTATRMIEDIVNTVTVAVNRGDKQETAYDEIHESVDNDGIVFMNSNLNKTVSNADINLSKLLKGDMEVTYTIENIGHAENSRDNMADYILSDSGMTIYNLMNGNVYSPDINSRNKSMDYAWFNKIIFPAHGVYFDENKTEPLKLKITYYVYDGVLIKEESGVWTADINTIIQAANGEKIVAFKAEAPILPQEFKNIKVTVNAIIKQADKSDFYGYINSAYPDVETDIFNIGNTARQAAKNPYEEGKALEIEKDCEIRIKASNNPNFNLKKQSIPSVIEKTSWYMSDRLIKYEITGILNDTDETLDEVVITDDSMKINVNAGEEDTDLSFAIKSIGLKLDESGMGLEELRSSKGFQISYETENKALMKVTESFLRNGIFEVNSDDLGKTYRVIIENMPPSFGLVIDFKVSLDSPENYEQLANIVSITNKAVLRYLFKEKTTTVYSAQNTVDIKEEPQDFGIYKSSPKQKYDKGEKVQWDIYLINDDPGSANRPSILIDPIVWDVLPYSFSDPNTIKMISPKSITYGTMTAEEIAAHDFSNINETDIGVKCVDGNGVRSQEIIGNRPLNKITWQFEGELNYKEVIHIKFEAQLDKFAEPVSAVNKAYAKSEAQNTAVKEAKAEINVINNTNVIAKVESNGNLNPAGVYYAFPPIATAMPGSIANYKISVANYSAGNANIQGIKMADLLPYLVFGGDKETGIIDIWDSRGSEWQPTLYNIGTYKVYSLDTDGNEIYNEEKTKQLNETPPTVYLSETRDGRIIENAMKNNDFSGWAIMDEYTDLSRYNSFVVVFNPGFALEYREKIVFIADVAIPGVDDTIWNSIETKMDNGEKADCIAWNSTAVFYDGASFVVEPNMAGINVVFSELGDRVWYDTDEDGLQSAENDDTSDRGKATEFAYKDKGVEGLSVFLFKIDDGGNMEYVAQVTTDANGSYRFSRIPQGKYVIGFEKRDSFIFTKQNDTNDYLNSSVYDGQDSDRIIVYNDNGNTIDLYLTNPITLGVSSIDRTWDAGITGGGQLTVRKLLQNSNGKAIPFEDKTFNVEIFSVDGDGKEAKVKTITFDKDFLEAVILLPFGEYIVREADAEKYNVTITDDGKVEFNKDLLYKSITVTNKEKPPVAEPSPSSGPAVSPSSGPIVSPSPNPIVSGRPGGGTIINPDTKPVPTPTAIQRVNTIPSASVPFSNVSPITKPADEIVRVPNESPALGGLRAGSLESEAVVMPSEEIPAKKSNPITGENFIYKYNMIFILGIIIFVLLEIRDIYTKRRKAD